MKNPIGFVFQGQTQKPETELPPRQETVPVKSTVQVFFQERNQTLTYYNDQFDLQRGDLVFVDGKLAGIPGVIREVNRNFKIRVADYQKVISVADTNVSGKLYIAGDHFLSFDRTTLPYSKLRAWFLPPVEEEDPYETGNDDTAFFLENLREMDVTPEIFDRGRRYYLDDNVRYFCVEDGHVQAIVAGTHAYEVEFDFVNGQIQNLLCDCPCGYSCKHQVAALLQLKETLFLIDRFYPELYGEYFAAIYKEDLYRFAIDSRESGCITL